MKRNNGFIDLNSYFHKIKKNNKWHNYDFLLKGIIEPSLEKENHYWLTIKGNKFYFKPTNYAYHEIIAYFIAEYLGFDVAPCDLAELKDKNHENTRGIISLSYKKKNARYIAGYEILKEYYKKYPEVIKDMGLTDEWQRYYEGPYYIDMNNLEIIWQALECRYGNRPDVNISLLMDQIIDQYKFSILTRANDKGAQNWEVEEASDGVRICPIFDNEIIFNDENTTAAFSVGFEDNDKSIKESIKRFLSISSTEFIDEFLEQFNCFELDDLLRIMHKVEKHIGCEIPPQVKEEIIQNFKLNRKEIEEAMEELNLKVKGR